MLLDIKIILATMLSWSLLDYVVKQFHKHEQHTDSDYSSILALVDLWISASARGHAILQNNLA